MVSRKRTGSITKSQQQRTDSFMFTTILLFTLVMSPVVAKAIRRRKKILLQQKQETWSIGIYEGPSPVKLSSPKGLKNPILTAACVTDIKARFVADPFMIRNSDGFHLFFEVMNEKRNTGEIAYAYSRDCVQWEYRRVVLKERFHLSYPYVFFWEGVYYMIPECRTSWGIQLYKATQFPDSWQRVATLVKGSRSYCPLLDPSIIRHENRWYLFGYARKSGRKKVHNLHLFSADTLTGPWAEHPQSPVISSNPHHARPGGRIVAADGALYRYAQDGVPNYGSKVWAFRITTLTQELYREIPAPDGPVLQAGNESWNNAGMHTVDPHQLTDGQWFAFVDGLRKIE
jgi:hypothetical protein